MSLDMSLMMSDKIKSSEKNSTPIETPKGADYRYLRQMDEHAK